MLGLSCGECRGLRRRVGGKETLQVKEEKEMEHK